MHATTVALLASASFAACVPDPPRPERTDAGVAALQCDSTQTVTMDLTVDSATLPDAVPTDGCWTLAGKLTVRGSSVTSLSMLAQIVGANEVELDDTMLTSVDTAGTLAVSGPITITNNSALTGIDRLHAGTTATVVLIDTNAVLADFGSAFDDLAQVGTTFTVRNNAALTSLELPKLQLVGDVSIGQSLLITNNAALTEIELPAFTLPNRLEISNNLKLSSIGDIPATQVVSDLVIRNNPVLATLPNFPALAKIGGDLIISGNQTLSAMGSFPALIGIYGTLNVDSNPQLGSIGGLPASTAVGIQTLSITNNVLLTDLGRLAHETYGSITITGNTTLPNCKAREVDVCTTHTAQSTISGNKTQNNCTSWCGR